MTADGGEDGRAAPGMSPGRRAVDQAGEELRSMMGEQPMARAQLAHLLGVAQVGVWELDAETGAVWGSALALDIVGLRSDGAGLTRKAFDDAVHHDDLARVRAARQTFKQTGHLDIVHRIVRPDGGVRVVQVRAEGPVPSANGTRMIRGTVQDVTELSVTRQALEDIESSLARVLAAANDGWWDIDLRTGAAFHSQRWWEIHGASPGSRESDADLWRSFAHPADLDRLERELVEVVAARRSTFTTSGRVVRADGREAIIVVRALVDYAEGGQPVRVSGVTTDVTELRRAEAEREAVVATVSHELRTPLTSIAGAIETLQAGVAGGLEEPVAALVDVAGRNVARLRRLIDDLLDMEQLLAGRLTMSRSRHDLASLAAQAALEHALLAQAAGVALVHHHHGEPVDVEVDDGRIAQVLGNLLANALRFAPRGSTVELRSARLDATAVVEVIDRGPGVPEEFADRLFDRFAQAQPRRSGGSGLGLAISRGIAEQHDGRLTYDSRPGCTVFRVELPVASGR